MRYKNTTSSRASNRRSWNRLSSRDGPGAAWAAPLAGQGLARSIPRRVEVAQVRRLLAFLGRHQIAVSAHKIVLLADHDVIVVLGAEVLVQLDIPLAPVGLH